MIVTQYLRRSPKKTFSIERIFEDVRNRLPSEICVNVCYNRFWSAGVIRRLFDAIRARNYQGDINHITGDVHYLTYFLKRQRTILTIHDCTSLQHSHGLRHWLLWLFWYWLPEKRCSVISVVSASTRQEVLRYLRCDPQKVRIIYNNVSDEFQPTEKLFETACPRILHIGKTANKNIERHVEALEGIKCILVIIGELNDAHRRVLNLYSVNYENHVRLSREGLVQQYKDCDLLLFASTYEGFGLPIVEAQAVGRPVVTSNLWSMPEVAGGAACLVNPFDVQSIRLGVQRVIVDAAYRQELIRSGFENIKRFSTENIAAQYADLYRSVYKKCVSVT